MKLPIVGVRQIKLPVTDLPISARWYADFFDLELANEFFEDGAVRGVVLADHEAGFVIGLCEREYCASTPDLGGFDVCAFMLWTLEDMSTVIDRCAALGIEHGEVHDRGDDVAAAERQHVRRRHPVSSTLEFRMSTDSLTKV